MAERGAAAAPSRRRSKRRQSETVDHQQLRPCCSRLIPSVTYLRACSTAYTAYPSWGSKRSRTTLSRSPPLPGDNKWRDWANLAEGPAGLIAERVLANDVADYVRFRAVCRPWQQCSPDTRGHDVLDRRFHPRRWVMLREELAPPHRRRFLNVSTGECVKVDLVELRDHDMLGLTVEGLLVLLHGRAHVRLLNPLTGQLTELPPLTTLLPPEQHSDLSDGNIYFDEDFRAWGSGIADDDSTVVLCFHSLSRFYCVTEHGVMVLQTSADQPPRLEVSAKLRRRLSPMLMDSAHLVDNVGDLMLVQRTLRRNNSRRYGVYKLDLDTGTLFPVKSLGGHALFMGMYCSLSVSTEIFPFIGGDTIYLSFDMRERVHDEQIEAYHLPDRTTKAAHYNLDSSLPRKVVPWPHSIVDCFSLCNTVGLRSNHLASVI